MLGTLFRSRQGTSFALCCTAVNRRGCRRHSPHARTTAAACTGDARVLGVAIRLSASAAGGEPSADAIGPSTCPIDWPERPRFLRDEGFSLAETAHRGLGRPRRHGGHQVYQLGTRRPALREASRPGPIVLPRRLRPSGGRRQRQRQRRQATWRRSTSTR